MSASSQQPPRRRAHASSPREPSQPRGRPSKRTHERAEAILASLLAGYTLDAAARENDMTYQTLNAWRNDEPAFARAVKAAQAAAEQARIAYEQPAHEQPHPNKRAPHRKHRAAETVDPAYSRQYLDELASALYERQWAEARERLDAALANQALRNKIAELEATIAQLKTRH